MPLPLLIIIPCAVTTAIGGYNAVRGISKGNEAAEMIDSENDKNTKTYDSYLHTVEICNKKLDKLTEIRLVCHNEVMLKLIDTMKFFKGVKYVPNDLFSLKISESAIIKNKLNLKSNIAANEISLDVFKVVSTGATAGKGALVLTSTFAKASTGTAISGLKGVAATKATYAALGGGAIKAGGLGVVGGKIVLCGIVAAPVVLITGICMNKYGEKKITSAVHYEKASTEFRALLNKEIICLKGINTRTQELGSLINQLANRLSALNDKLNNLKTAITKQNSSQQSKRVMDYLKEEDYKLIQNAVLMTKAVKDLLVVPVYDEEGSLTEDGRQCLIRGRNILHDLQS